MLVHLRAESMKQPLSFLQMCAHVQYANGRVGIYTTVLRPLHQKSHLKMEKEWSQRRQSPPHSHLYIYTYICGCVLPIRASRVRQLYGKDQWLLYMAKECGDTAKRGQLFDLSQFVRVSP